MVVNQIRHHLVDPVLSIALGPNVGIGVIVLGVDYAGVVDFVDCFKHLEIERAVLTN